MGTLKDLLARTLKPGMVIGGAYQLERRLGAGGFGEVWKALDQRRTVQVALKLMPHQQVRLPAVQASLVQECVVLKTLTHPHICRVLDLVQDATYGPLLITELIDGIDCVAATRGTSLEHCWRMAIQTLAALSYLHGRGVLHLDIKPANVLVAAEGVKLIDFGLAAIAAPTPGAGTLGYMAPERIRGEAVDARADLYAVGVLLYECLSGTNPFQARQPAAIRQKHSEWMPPPVSQIRANCPIWVDTVLAALLAKNPANRYVSAKAVLNEFQLVLGDTVVQQTIGRTSSQVFATAAGRFIGREATIEPLRTAWKQAAEEFNSRTCGVEGGVSGQTGSSEARQTGNASIILPVGGATQAPVIDTPMIRWVHIAGAAGMGKSRLLRELKFAAQLAGCRTLWFDAAVDTTPAALQPIADALATAQSPLVLCLDDYDQWHNALDAHDLTGLLTTLTTHPHPPTSIWCIMTQQIPRALIEGVDSASYPLAPFTNEELSAYVSAVAPVPATHLTGFVEKVHERTEGVPAKVVLLMQGLVRRGYFTTTSGQWDAQLFTDVVIDLPAPEGAGGADTPMTNPDILLTLCRHDRATGHAGRALAQLSTYWNSCGGMQSSIVTPERAVALAIEAAECALTVGHAHDAQPILERCLNDCPDYRGRLLLWQGILSMAERKYVPADAALRDALVWARTHADRGLMLTVQNHMARSALLQKHYDQAIAGFRATQAVLKEFPPEVAAQIVNNELGHALLLTGQLQEAAAVLTDTIDRCRAAGALRRTLRAQLWRAECRRLLGEGEKALADTEAVVQEARRAQYLPLLAEAYNGLGMLHCQRGDSTQGLVYYEQAVALAYMVHDLATVAMVTTNIGLERLRRGENASASHALETALVFLDHQAEATAIERAAVPARIALAEIARQEQNYEEALAFLSTAETLAIQHQLLPQYQFALVLTQAEIARDRRDGETARTLGLRAQPLAHSPIEQQTWQSLMDSLGTQDSAARR
ncbi:MAG: protein kinase [Deltaproteobacteria bacterium]|nr:protein kinase [Deltaproteobacteria bacterium]